MTLIQVLVVICVCAVGVYSQTCNCVSSCGNVRPGKYQSCVSTIGWARCFLGNLLITGNCKTGKYWDDTQVKCVLTNNSPASVVPCQNGGTCQPLDLGYKCICPPTATGALCETKQGLCVNNPCVLGATCVDTTTSKGVASFTCNCPANSPPGCKNYPNPCDSNPCANGGTCYSNGTDFTCSCPNGYGGQSCNQVVTVCSPNNPCSNNGKCSPATNDNGFLCTCTKNYTGETCDDEVNACDSSPCLNGGSCFSQLSVFSCTCAAGWTGPTCSTAVAACSSSPCQNGGTCTSSGSTYTCACTSNFTGSQCQTRAAVCSSNPCSGKQCCTTPTGYTCQ